MAESLYIRKRAPMIEHRFGKPWTYRWQQLTGIQPPIQAKNRLANSSGSYRSGEMTVAKAKRIKPKPRKIKKSLEMGHSFPVHCPSIIEEIISDAVT